MNSAVSDYFAQFLPILLGVAFVIAARHVALAGDRMVIRVSGISQNAKAEADTESQTWMDRAYGLEKEGDGAFYKEAYDALLVNGAMPKNKSAESVRKEAFRKLGFAELSWLPELTRGIKSHQPKLTLFVTGKEELYKQLLGFRRDSGVLMQYLADYALSTEVI